IPKIADFKIKESNSTATVPVGRPVIANAPVPPGNIISMSDHSKENNTWKWVLGGILVVGVGYFIYDHYREKKKREKN
ncbi:MAG: hypothetical protein ACXVED_18840, partial [Bacteroidia bacterium]